MDIETILLVRNINSVIIALEVLVFIMAFIGWFYSYRNNQPLDKKKGRIVLTIISLVVVSPLLGTAASVPIMSSSAISKNVHFTGLPFISGNLSIISFVVLFCIIWLTGRKPKNQKTSARV